MARKLYHPDHLGSTSYITDASGEVYQHLEYFAFGGTFVEEHSNTNRTPYLFNGKELDEETGLYYYGARYYDPVTSIFPSVDPLADKYPSISSYAYAFNNPLKYTDPTGMEGEGVTDPPTHKVQKGETLSAIAKKHGTTVGNIQKLNNIENPDKIYAGSNLKISSGNPSTVKRKEGGETEWYQKAWSLTKQKSSNAASNFLRVGSIITTSIIQNYSMALTEGVHEGGPKNPELNIAKEYYFDNWSLKSNDLGISVPPAEQSLKTIKATSDVLLSIIPLKPTITVGSPIFKKIAPKIFEMGVKESLKKGRDAGLNHLNSKN